MENRKYDNRNYDNSNQKILARQWSTFVKFLEKDSRTLIRVLGFWELLEGLVIIFIMLTPCFDKVSGIDDSS